MKALTQCWFTRMHIPEGRAHKEEDGSHTSWCRHCERAIVSWDKARWFLADGFNVTHLAETVGGRFLFVLDIAEEAIVARYPLKDMAEEALEAFKAQLRERHGIGQPGATLELHDSGATPAARRKAAAKQATRRAPPMGRRDRLSASF